MDSSMALITISRFSVVCIAAFALQLFFSPSSYPIYLEIPPSTSLLPAPSNGKLQDVIKLGEGLLIQPEDVAIDKNGVLYTATRDGSVKRLHRNGTWETWRQIKSSTLFGITTTAAGDVIVCDPYKGLVKFSHEEGVEVITSHVDGERIGFADDVIESSNGTLYFSDASTKFDFHSWSLEMLEMQPHGRLLKFDPSSNITSVVLDGLAFANGVALSADQDYLVVCETLKFRCLKYWLEGDKKGQTQIFVDKLPGRPDNINLAPDGSFWIALLEVSPMWPRFVYKLPGLKYLTGAYPKILSNWVVNIAEKAMVVNVASDGRIIRGFDDPTGKVVRFVTSAVEFEGHLYLGSLHNDFVGKLPLPLSSA